jgi:hypothetical protein
MEGREFVALIGTGECTDESAGAQIEPEPRVQLHLRNPKPRDVSNSQHRGDIECIEVAWREIESTAVLNLHSPRFRPHVSRCWIQIFHLGTGANYLSLFESCTVRRFELF